MNISFDKADAVAAGAQTNVDRDTTSYRTPQSTGKVDTGGFALDISGTVMDNSAYAGHGRTAEEVMLEAGQEDITARRNYMAVMSNSMSDEDFAKLQEEGFHPGSTDIETVVTIVDHIKAALVKGGAQITGYTDTVSEDKLREITGSETFAQELVKQFHEQDIPVTEENAAMAADAWKMLQEVPSLTEDSIKYMVENDREPTPENLYTARFSAAEGSSRQGKGYYADGSVAGYYAKKPEEINYSSLLPQMEKVIEDAGYEISEENLSGAKWLVENGIPLNTDTYSRLMEISEVSFPVTEEEFLQAAACAVSDGKTPLKADLNQKESLTRQAVRIWENIDILFDEKTIQSVKDRRLLEEARLSMTVESNLKLLRSGFQIETASLEELVEALKAAEQEIEKTLTRQTDAQAASQKTSLYRETLSVLQGIQASPAAILSQIEEEDTLPVIHQKGTDQAAEYQKAGQAYETMMTTPRRDMGDTISKAFRNVDDILTDLGIEPTENSRRAVRILSYNEVEITAENVQQIENKDGLLTDVLNQMKPGRVLEMIRQGVNPLNMSLSELSEYLNGQTDTAQEMESYSKFLYRLEKQNDITEEERSAFIGIYRLTRQLQKADDASVGALWQMNADFTLENLLTANRSLKRTGREYKVDDSFGGVEAAKTEAENIISQIQKGFVPKREDLSNMLDQAGDQKAQKEMERLLYDEVRAAVKSEEAVLRQLTDYAQPVTADNLQTMQLMLKSPADIWKNMSRFTGEGKSGRVKKEQEILDGAKEVLQSLDDSEQAAEAYESFTARLQDILENRVFHEESNAVDVRAMSTLYKQMSFLTGMSREENYEIPMEIDGSLTSVNLKIIHTKEQESKVAITLETTSLGKTAAEFKMTEKGISGLCICSMQEGAELLREQEDILTGKLLEEQLLGGEIYFAAGEKLDLTEFALKETADRQQAAGTGELYKAARAFIGFVQEAAQRKGADI